MRRMGRFVVMLSQRKPHSDRVWSATRQNYNTFLILQQPLMPQATGAGMPRPQASWDTEVSDGMLQSLRRGTRSLDRLN